MIPLRQSAVGVRTGQGGFTVTLGQAALPGSLLVLFVTFRNTAATNLAQPGWTPVPSVNGVGQTGNGQMFAYYRTAVAGDGASFAIADNADASPRHAVLAEFTGAAPLAVATASEEEQALAAALACGPLAPVTPGEHLIVGAFQCGGSGVPGGGSLPDLSPGVGFTTIDDGGTGALRDVGPVMLVEYRVADLAAATDLTATAATGGFADGPTAAIALLFAGAPGSAAGVIPRYY